jgi:hypothetical protein
MVLLWRFSKILCIALQKNLCNRLLRESDCVFCPEIKVCGPTKSAKACDEIVVGNSVPSKTGIWYQWVKEVNEKAF